MQTDKAQNIMNPINAIARLVMVLVFLLLFTAAAQAQGITFSGQGSGKGGARSLPVEFATAVFEIESEPGARVIMLELTPASGQYAYANDPGEAIGRPTTVTPKFEVPAHTPNFTIVYPLGKQIADVYSGGRQVNVYDETVSIFIYLPAIQLSSPVDNATASPQAFDFKAELKISLLICSIQNCTPVNQVLPLEVKAEAVLPNAEDQHWWKDFSESLLIIHNTMPAMNPVYDSPGLEIESLGKALVFGFMAGLILNFMPCVFPVVSLKLLSFIITLGQPDSEKRLSAFRRQNLMFALGVIVWFTILSAVLSALDLLWGQLFQSQAMVIGMLVLVFALTLSLFGLFMLPSFAFREHQGRITKRSAFITGMLATCLATPCSGPLLGGVLGWSFNQPQPILGMVFLAVGLGMASPYLLLAAFPRLGRHFPTPGPWLAKLEVILGFFLLLTCAYLFSLLTGSARTGAAITLGLVFVLGWFWGRRQNARGMRVTFYWRWLMGCACALLALIFIWNFVLFNKDEEQWVPYSEEAFLAARTNNNIVLDFTADWCPNCKLLERTVFTEERIKDWQERYNAVFMQVDLTHDNLEGYALLASLNSSSIPVVALFPKQNGESSELSPIVLRDLFGPARLEEAAEKAWSIPKH